MTGSLKERHILWEQRACKRVLPQLLKFSQISETSLLRLCVKFKRIFRKYCKSKKGKWPALCFLFACRYYHYLTAPASSVSVFQSSAHWTWNRTECFLIPAVNRSLLTIRSSDCLSSRWIRDNGQHMKLFKGTLEFKLQPSFPCNFSIRSWWLLVPCHGVKVNEIILWSVLLRAAPIQRST